MGFVVENYLSINCYNIDISKREKPLQKLRQNPKNVSFDELKQVLEDYGFEHMRTAGSHHTFIAIHGEKDWRLTIPFHRPIKQAYVMKSSP
ncbi:MAG: type II toxin-antitoxin system HicA family toxin [Chitinophagaceae bacterium]|nr:type II toxin-antitoxin system HicA family toxin [Anaerolineae bacterium]